MIVAQLLGADDAVKIGLHEFLDEVDLLELLEIGWTEDVEDGDDVLVMKVAKELDLAEGAEAEHGVVKGCYALDGDLALGGDVDRGAGGGSERVRCEPGDAPNDAVRALADHIQGLVVGADHKAVRGCAVVRIGHGERGSRWSSGEDHSIILRIYRTSPHSGYQAPKIEPRPSDLPPFVLPLTLPLTLPPTCFSLLVAYCPYIAFISLYYYYHANRGPCQGLRGHP